MDYVGGEMLGMITKIEDKTCRGLARLEERKSCD